MGVVVIIRIWGGQGLFFFQSFVCCVMLKWCCLLVIVSFRFWKMIGGLSRVCVLIRMWIFLFFRVLSRILCFFFFMLLDKKLICRFIFLRYLLIELQCCWARILVGVIRQAWKLLLIVSSMVMRFMMVLLLFILFCSSWFIWMFLFRFWWIFFRICFWVLVSLKGNLWLKKCMKCLFICLKLNFLIVFCCCWICRR